MSTEIQDVLKAYLVLVGVDLLNTPESINSFRDSIDSEISLSIVPGLPSHSRMITLPKHRISLSLESGRSTLEREYPSRDDLSMLAKVSHKAVYHTNLEGHIFQAFGFNIELVYDQDSGFPAAKYLSNKIFRNDFPGNDSWNLHGGSAKITFHSEDKYWNVTIEPRFNDSETSKVFLTLNLHRTDRRLPEEQGILDSLEETWDEAMKFVKHLD